MSGAGPLRIGLDDLKRLQAGSQRLGGSGGVAVQLCILTLALPWQLVAIDIERIDWRRETVEVPARGDRGTQILALSHAAIQVILQNAGSSVRRGQAISGGRGKRLTHRDLRLDRLRDALGAQAPDTLRIEWNFHGIRASAATELSKAGVDTDAISDVLGRRRPGLPREGRSAENTARSVVEQWAQLLSNGPAPKR